MDLRNTYNRIAEDYNTPEKLFALLEELVKNGRAPMRQPTVIVAGTSAA